MDPHLCQELWAFPGEALGHLSAARGQVEDGGGGHVGGFHVVRVVEAALAAGAAGAASSSPSSSSPSSSSTAETAAAGSVAARGAAGRARGLTVALGCTHTHTPGQTATINLDGWMNGWGNRKTDR